MFTVRVGREWAPVVAASFQQKTPMDAKDAGRGGKALREGDASCHALANNKRKT